MKIKELWFKNHADGWELERTTFSELTLLVGASGVGKTQILKAIEKLVYISNGHTFVGVEWDILFTTDDGGNYRWSGKFDDTSENGQKPKISYEKLCLEGKLVFERNQSTVKYEGKDAPKISLYTSILNLFVEEEKIIPVKFGLSKVTLIDYGEEIKYIIPAKSLMKVQKPFDELNAIPESEEKLKTISIIDDIIKTKNAPIIKKLFLYYKFLDKIFKEIILEFRDIFPQVEDVRFVPLKEDDLFELQIKENDTGWISMDEISSGMFKTLLHIAELKLMADGYVILIDEFENSLGVNCIDTVASNLVQPGRDIQYIITSHHPYIINNIDMKHWKVVTRKGSKVTTIDAEKLKLGKSKHEAFKQLLNLDEFAVGIS